MRGVSDPLFSFEYWLVNHKNTLRTWWAISLLAIILFGTVWSVGFLIFFVSQEHKVSLRMQQSVARLASWSPTTLGSPQDLAIGDALAVPAENGRFDIVAKITNPNEGWGATMIQSHCTVGGTSLPLPQAFVNPSESRYVVLGSQTVSGDVVCTIDSQVWHRTAAARIEQPTFTITKQSVVNTSAEIGGTTVPIVRVDATLRNDSGNNFSSVDVVVLVRSSGEIVAADTISLSRWATRSTKTLTNSWTLDQRGDTTVEILPTVTRFDATVVY